MKYTIKHNDTDYEVDVKRTSKGIVVTHGANEYVVTELESAGAVIAPAPSVSAPTVNTSPAPTPAQSSITSTAPVAGAGSNQIAAPMTGVIKTIHVSTGDTVTNGQVVITMEAMKMDITIEAKADGAVATISVTEGDAVQQGQGLLTIQ